MKKFLTKNWSLIGLIVGFMLDHSFDILKNSGLTLTQIDLIKGLGAIIAGYYWTSNHNVKVAKNR